MLRLAQSRSARRVDEQGGPRRTQRIRAAGERLVVAVSELPGADELVRAAKRAADALRAPWTGGAGVGQEGLNALDHARRGHGRHRRAELRGQRHGCHGSVVDRLVRETPGVTVHVLPVGEAPVERERTRP
jgi:two-component system sensor histidine kinase KdpD